MRARDKRTATENVSADVLPSRKKIKKTSEAGGNLPHPPPPRHLVRPRVNGTLMQRPLRRRARRNGCIRSRRGEVGHLKNLHITNANFPKTFVHDFSY